MSDQPHFRFNPNAYQSNRAFEASTEQCDVCDQPCGWRYTGSVYAEGDAPFVCARCISDGKLKAYMGDRSYSLHDAELEGVDAATQSELLERTPGVSSYNPFSWPVIAGKPLAFIGYGDEDAVWNDAAARKTLVDAYKADIDEELTEPTPYGLVFKQLDGPTYVAVIDAD
jgi:uncharacterized protein CbrC (UPF0167 family)